MRFEFVVRDTDGNVVFAVDKPSVELLEEEIGRWERHGKQNKEQSAEEN